MFESIVLLLLFVFLLVFSYFAYRLIKNIIDKSNESVEMLGKQMEQVSQMMMAGSYQEYDRISKGKKEVPNDIKDEPNFPELREDTKIPFDQIKNVKVNDGPARKIKIYK